MWKVTEAKKHLNILQSLERDWLDLDETPAFFVFVFMIYVNSSISGIGRIWIRAQMPFFPEVCGHSRLRS